MNWHPLCPHHRPFGFISRVLFVINAFCSFSSVPLFSVLLFHCVFLLYNSRTSRFIGCFSFALFSLFPYSSLISRFHSSTFFNRKEVYVFRVYFEQYLQSWERRPDRRVGWWLLWSECSRCSVQYWASWHRNNGAMGGGRSLSLQGSVHYCEVNYGYSVPAAQDAEQACQEPAWVVVYCRVRLPRWDDHA